MKASSVSDGSPDAPHRLRALVLDAKCLALLVAVRLALSTIGSSAIRRRLPQPRGMAGSRFYARQVARRIERLAPFVPGATCLTQALALQYVLGRAGHASRLKIGVRRDESGAFRAHAWVVCENRVVLGALGTPLDRFTPLAELD